ncbi:MAG: hypothetical protein RQ741_06535 [Wenzhouxiangellaceae bacterium]|nr:hypothetical protein [Wenzhouxiangellaceae bacterium]
MIRLTLIGAALGLLVAACAGTQPMPDRGTVEFTLIERGEGVVIHCRPLTLEVGPEWVDACNEQAERALIETRAGGRSIEIPDPPFGMASKAMRNNWETLRRSGALEAIMLSREIEPVKMI